MLQPLLVSTVFAAIGIVASAALRPIWWMIWVQIFPSNYTVPSWFNPTPLLIFLVDFPIAAVVGTSIGHVARTDRAVLWGLYGGALLVLGSGLVTGRLTLREDADGWTFFWTYLPAVLIASIAMLTAEKTNMHQRHHKDVA